MVVYIAASQNKSNHLMKSQNDTQIIEIDQTALPSTSSSTIQQGTYSPTVPHKKETDLRDLLQTLYERKGLILALTLLGTLISLLITLSTTPLYRANAIIKISPEENKLLDFDVSTSGSASKTEQYFLTQLKLLKSKGLARKVIQSLDLNAVTKPSQETETKPFFPEQVQKLKNLLRGTKTNPSTTAQARVAQSPIERSFFSRLHVSPMGKSYLVDVSYDAEDPELSAAVVNSLIQNFISMNLDGRLDSASHAKVFLADEIAQAKQKLQESEQKMIAFEKSKGIVNTGKHSLIDQKLSELNKALARATQQRIAAEAAYNSRPSRAVKKVTRNNKTVIALNRKLQKLKQSYQDKLKVYKPAYPLMKDIQYKIDETRKAIDEEKARLQQAQAPVNTTPDPKYKLEAAKRNEIALRRELNKTKSEAISSRDNTIEYQSLQHEVDANRGLYENLLKRQKEVKVAGGVDKNNISIIDPAVAPFSQHSPDTKINLLLGTLIGLLSSSLLVILMGHKDERIKSVEDIAKLSELPILGIFPFTKELSKKGAFNLIMENPSSVMAEAFRSLRTNMQFATAEGLPKILHITSSEASEGKSSTAINLATVFAQPKKSVLLIDADLRKPSIHRYLHLTDTVNLATGLLEGKRLDEMETMTAIPNLTVIAGKAPQSTPADLLSSDEMTALLNQASDKYDLVIVDSPPVVGLADALVLANRSTATLLIVASHQTTKSQLTQALTRIRMGYGNVIGFVFTKARKLKASSYVYEYGGDHISSNISHSSMSTHPRS